MNNFKIIIPMYNVEDWVETTIKSVMEQTHTNFNCIIVDDMSTDRTVEIVENLVKDDNRFTILINKEKKNSLRNKVEAINFSKPNDEDIIAIIDGDDWLSNQNVLSYVNQTYIKENCLLTYGNHTNFPDGEPYWPLFAYPQEVIDNNSFRNFRFLASHLRTFKYKIWKLVDDNDLRDSNGEYYKMTSDLAEMFPLLELAGNRSKFIDKTLYVYNNKNPLNDYKVNHDLQLQTELKLRMKNKYKPFKEQI